jgi:hypothetical protein
VGVEERVAALAQVEQVRAQNQAEGGLPHEIGILARDQAGGQRAGMAKKRKSTDLKGSKINFNLLPLAKTCQRNTSTGVAERQKINFNLLPLSHHHITTDSQHTHKSHIQMIHITRTSNFVSLIVVSNLATWVMAEKPRMVKAWSAVYTTNFLCWLMSQRQEMALVILGTSSDWALVEGVLAGI